MPDSEQSCLDKQILEIQTANQEDEMAINSAKQDKETPQLEKCLGTLRKLQTELQDQGILHAHIFRDVTRGKAALKSDINIIVDIDDRKAFDVLDLIGLEKELTRKFHHRVGVISIGGLKVPMHDYIRKGMKQGF